MKPVETERCITGAEYTAYKALKEGIALEGYHDISRQFNVMAKVGYIGEAIDRLLESRKPEALFQALDDLALEDDVRKGLQQEALQSLIKLGKKEHWDGNGFNWQRVSYGLTPELSAAITKYGHIPFVAEGIASFLLYDELPEHEIQWALKPEHVRAAIDVLLDADRPRGYIVDELLKGIQGKTGAFHTIVKYAEGISENRQEMHKDYRPFHVQVSQAHKHKEIYALLYERLPDVITPDTIEDAVRQLKLPEEAYYKEGPRLGRPMYAKLKTTKERLESGTPFELEHGVQYDSGGIKRLNEDFHEFMQRQLRPLMLVLQDFTVELGSEQFAAKGYGRAQEAVAALRDEMEQMHNAVMKGVDTLEREAGTRQEGSQSRQQPQKPWYKRLVRG